MHTDPVLLPVLRYIEQVQSGEILACKPVKEAVQRHLDDLKSGHKRGLYFDDAAAAKTLKFFPYLHHSKGKWAGTVFIPEDWQAFIVYCLFGWKRTGGTRRFRTAYVEVPRKMGKTTLGAGIANYMLIGDGEAGAEIYTGATTRDQAKICFNEAQEMIRKSPALNKRATVLAHNVHVLATASKMQPVSSDHNVLDGLNPHCVILDEIHAYRDSGLFDIFVSAIGARTQPLIFMITTAGFNKEWFCYNYRKYVLSILNKSVRDDSIFGIVYTLDDGDEWTDETNWFKSNPNLGVSVSLDYLRSRVKTAMQRPSEQVNVKTKNLNVWTDAPKVWITAETWGKGNLPVNEMKLRGQVCYGGLDLATKEDFNALVLVFPDGEGSFDVVCRFWIPKATVDKRRTEGLTQIDEWISGGWLRVTEGEMVDYDQILADILEDFGTFDLRSIAKDAWNSAWMYQQLNAVLEPLYHEGKYIPRVSDFSQTIKNMTSPTVYVEDLCDQGKLRHGGNPVLSWMMGNVALEMIGKEVEDPITGKPQQARKPSKLKSQKKIDGAVSLVMALGEYLTLNWTSTGSSNVYEDRGFMDWDNL